MPTYFAVPDMFAMLRAMQGCNSDGDDVDELSHALQTAELAFVAGADPEVVTAALLHDIGRAPEVAAQYPDIPHELAGAAFCRRHCTERVAFLVAQHVPAKRYLVTVDGDYAEALSPTSQRSLIRQGGPMTAEEVAEFESNPWARDAAQLRRWDDAAKVPEAPTHGLDFFAPIVAHVWARG